MPMTRWTTLSFQRVSCQTHCTCGIGYAACIVQSRDIEIAHPHFCFHYAEQLLMARYCCQNFPIPRSSLNPGSVSWKSFCDPLWSLIKIVNSNLSWESLLHGYAPLLPWLSALREAWRSGWNRSRKWVLSTWILVYKLGHKQEKLDNTNRTKVAICHLPFVSDETYPPYMWSYPSKTLYLS